jgi:hypothetical protein
MSTAAIPVAMLENRKWRFPAHVATRIVRSIEVEPITINTGGGSILVLGFNLNLWDYLTFATVAVLVGAFLVIAVLVLGLPGRIAIARKHPDAEAINMMGWLGFLAVVPWMQAFMWAFKPTNVVDIRYFPKQEQQNIGEELARLTGKTPGKKPEPMEARPQAEHGPRPAEPPS